MRNVQQPGPAPPSRAVAVPCGAVPVEAELPAGMKLLDALHELVAAHGADSASLSLAGGALGPFGYVMPALSPDASHAAWYSPPHHPTGVTRWEQGCVTVGWRDGQKFFHCHGIWREADDRRSGGHVLPEATAIAAPIRAAGVVIHGARFEAVDDPETGFRLFEPVAPGNSLPPRGDRAATRTDAASAGQGRGGAATNDRLPPGTNALALRLRPNQDITLALEGLASAAGYASARVAGGVGSIIGARFTDAPPIEPFATEIFLTGGAIEALGCGLVDLSGALAEGRLVRADNPILMTLEVVLVAG
jgi:predicted DNA-binding protein with PD1-like motif